MGLLLNLFRQLKCTSPQLKRYGKELSVFTLLCIGRTVCNTPGKPTIFALSTPSGVSAIAVVRISGPNASDVLNRMGNFQILPIPRKATLCKIKDPESKELLDKSLVLWFPSPNSFSGEDMCELHLHGGIAVVKSVLKALFKMRHFRMAEPGEFTKRAFLANKLDLTEVEGLSDLLNAETEMQQKQALRQMDGVLYSLYTDWSQRIKRCLANAEAYIDFSEDQNLEESILKTVQKDVDKLKEEIEMHISDYRHGERQRNGVFTVLIGRPNVGKSSLLNNLCQRDIAIVSPTAGTTRDIIETSINLDGVLVNISDTAGIRDTVDSIEIEGVKRAKHRSSNADLLILITEAKKILELFKMGQLRREELVNQILLMELGENFAKGIKCFMNVKDSFEEDSKTNPKIILLLNKTDLLKEEEKERLMEFEDSSVCAISCTDGTGMIKFLESFKNIVKEMCMTHRGEEPVITQERHRIYVDSACRTFVIMKATLKLTLQ